MTDLPDAIRQNPRCQSVHAAREANAARARQAQATFKRLNRLFILATACAAVFGGLLLYGINPAPPSADPAGPGVSAQLYALLGLQWLRIAIAVLQAAALGLAACAAYLLTQRDYAATWLDDRLKAEQGRLDLARLALEIGHAKGPEPFRAAGAWFTDTLIGVLSPAFISAPKSRVESSGDPSVVHRQGWIMVDRNVPSVHSSGQMK